MSGRPRRFVESIGVIAMTRTTLLLRLLGLTALALPAGCEGIEIERGDDTVASSATYTDADYFNHWSRDLDLSDARLGVQPTPPPRR